MSCFAEKRPTKLYIDLKAIDYNIKAIKELLSSETEIMAVIKANSYGCGSAKIAQTLIENGVKRFAVAIPEEAIILRQQGISNPILVLTPPLLTDISEIVEYDLISSVSDIEIARALDELCKLHDKTIKIHIEIDTGMGRTGLQPQEAVKLIQELGSLKHVQVEGIFTHFSSADSDFDFTRQQLFRFDNTVSELEDLAIHIPIRHLCSSAGIIFFPQAHYEMVRPGLILYGYLPDQKVKEKITLKPSLTLKTKIVHIKEVPPQTPISYNQTYVTDRVSKIATLPIGYADGYPRALSNKGKVLIKGQIAPIVGRVCMDLLMVDVTHIQNVQKGDEVILFDNDKIKVEDIAKECGTISYEIISTISGRVPRIYVE